MSNHQPFWIISKQYTLIHLRYRAPSEVVGPTNLLLWSSYHLLQSFDSISNQMCMNESSILPNNIV